MERYPREYTAKESNRVVRIGEKWLEKDCYRIEARGLEKGRPKQVQKLEVSSAEGRDGD